MDQTIFIVDDDVEALRLIGLMLERKGYEIEAATSGKQALEKIKEVDPELIILDVMMPEINGYTVARRLRDDPETTDIPILFFTAKSGTNDKITGFQSGGDDYITKPIHPAELLSRVEALLTRAARQQSEAERAKVLTFLASKGGIGNSTLALNAALMLKDRQENQRVLLVEYCEGTGSIALQLGNVGFQGLQNLAGNLKDDLTPDIFEPRTMKHPSGLHILPATESPAGATDTLDEEFMKQLLAYVMPRYDLVIFDARPQLKNGLPEMLRRAAYILITVEPNQLALKLADALLNTLHDINISEYKARLELLNRAPSATSLSREKITETLNRDILGSIPAVPDLAQESWNHNRPMVEMHPISLYSQQVKMIIDDVLATL
jgi:pilus assembly protein CpaE